MDNVTDDLDRRLRAARPAEARADEGAFDAELLARVRGGPIAARRSVPRTLAVPVAAGVTFTATAVVMLGAPGDVGGPSSASAITQALRWLNPPNGTVLHVRSVETSADGTTTRELWQSAAHPALARMRTTGTSRFESAGDAVYDPATNTIYDPPDAAPQSDGGDPRTEKTTKATSDKAKRKPAEKSTEATTDKPRPRPAEQTTAATAGKAKPRPAKERMPAADPIVTKVRMLLQEGRMTVTGREVHNGVDAWAVSLKPDAGRPAWTLWVSADDGKPLELRDPGRDASDPPQVVRWPTYEVLPETAAEQELTLTGAHPSARVVTDPAQVAAAQRRLVPRKG